MSDEFNWGDRRVFPLPLDRYPDNIREAIEAYMARIARGEVANRTILETDSQPIRKP